jgi:hypothetical protein
MGGAIRTAAWGVLAVGATGLVARASQELTLVPIVGTWKAGTEAGRATLTIQGSAAPPAVDASAAGSLFGAEAPQLLASVSAQPAFPLAVARDVPDFRGGTLRVQIKLLQGTDDRSGGIVFNLKPDGTYNFARYNTKDGNVAIWKFEQGTRSVLAHGEEHQQLPTGQWQTLVVTISGNDVTAVVNNRLRVQHTLDQPVSGRIGLWSKPDVVTAFSGLRATPIR